MATRKMLVCDLDNTLYDWVRYFVPSFYAMVDAAVEIMDCERDRLLDDFCKVHQSHHDSEQPFALLETDTVRQRYQGVPFSVVAKTLILPFMPSTLPASGICNFIRAVLETLGALTRSGVTLVAHTESRLYGAIDRLDRLDLIGFFRRVYCRERSVTVHPDAQAHERWIAKIPADKVRELSHHQVKPDPDVLLEICCAEGASPEETAYVGDSIARDVMMARRAGVFAIWAAYGATHDPSMYDALVRITHWTPSEVAREKQLRDEAKSIKPDYVAYRSFREVASALAISVP